jgi:hypothetical protein
VVEAVANEEYVVDEEYPNERTEVVADTPADGCVHASYEIKPVLVMVKLGYVPVTLMPVPFASETV